VPFPIPSPIVDVASAPLMGLVVKRSPPQPDTLSTPHLSIDEAPEAPQFSGSTPSPLRVT
jgi:hypothetical protein